MKKKFFTAALALISAATFTACSQSADLHNTENVNFVPTNAMADGYYMESPLQSDEEFNTEEYSAIKESGFKSPKSEPLSTFSADVDTASYTNIRRFINNGEKVPEGAVRIEEMLNYFSYDYPEPEEGKAFSTTAEIGDCPWNADTKLMKIGLQTKKIDSTEMPPSNLVFLIDSSGSMYSADKLPLIKKAFSLVIENMSENDRISIVTYASGDKTLMDGGRIQDKDNILEILSTLEASGSTNGSGGIEAAYKLAEKHFIDGGINRVILATDGDLNVGITSESGLKKLIEEKRESGVYLSVIGVGTGNIKDNKMETLADNGNGNYSYVDSVNEAKRVLIEEKGATFFTVAKDVKFQVEFNPDAVKGYRLIGYENRALDNSDFTNDAKDAGELGAGHSVTVLYEIALTGSNQEVSEPNLEFSSQSGTGSTDICKISTRYKPIGSETSVQEDTIVSREKLEESVSDDFDFAAAVAEFGMILRNSDYKGTADYDSVMELAKDSGEEEFLELVQKAKDLPIRD